MAKRNCLIAQSGGPTCAINASVVGVLDENRKVRYYDRIYAGIHGIEGILDKKIIDLTKLTYEDFKLLKYTPSSSLGSCRYRLRDFEYDDEEYVRFFNILESLNIHTFFYIGGNDSMDTVNKLSEYAKLNGIDRQFIGIPKTIDNDLDYTDHAPGYGSAAKYIATLALETYLDSSVYINNGIFILETMGRDTGWLAASASLAKLNGRQIADFIYLPEVVFSEEDFLRDVRKRFKEKNKVYIVVSEGLKDKNGNYLYDTEPIDDSFSHPQLGGVGIYLKNLIVNEGTTRRVKVLQLGTAQRCAMHIASKTDIEEAYLVGKNALKYAVEGYTGFMIALNRLGNNPYRVETFRVEISKVANRVKHFPRKWITDENNNVTRETIDYINPLILGEASLSLEDGIPNYLFILDNI